MNGLYTDAELRDQTHARDARAVGNFEVHFTDPAPWIAALKADHQARAIADNIVWLAVVRAGARLDHLPGGRPYDTRPAVLFATLYIEANYIARGQMQKLSAYAGVTPKDVTTATPEHRRWAEKTALRVQELASQVQAALSPLVKHGLEVRSGGSLHLHNLDDPWSSTPELSITALPEQHCATCGASLHYANNQWRDETGAFEALKDGAGRDGRAIKVLDHVHDPGEKGRMV